MFLIHTEEAWVVCFFRVKACREKQTNGLCIIQCKKRSRLQLHRVSIFTELVSPVYVKNFFSVGLNFLLPKFDSSSS